MCLQSRDMFKILVSEMNHSSVIMKWRWTQWMFFYFMVSGTRSLVTVHQPALLTAALGHDVIMPCKLNLSHDDKLLGKPVLYWRYNSSVNVYPLSDQYEGRVNLVEDVNSTDKSILLKNVQWTDSGNYLCKLSITTEKEKSFRIKGNGTLLIVHDNMLFNLSGHNDSQLQCEVNVTRDPRIVLSIVHDECKFQNERDVVPSLPYATLSKTISLKSKGNYECQLRLNEDLIIKRIFHWNPMVTREGEDVEKCSATGAERVVVPSEPWFLYVALLLVPAIILLCLATAMLLARC